GLPDGTRTPPDTPPRTLPGRGRYPPVPSPGTTTPSPAGAIPGERGPPAAPGTTGIGDQREGEGTSRFPTLPELPVFALPSKHGKTAGPSASRVSTLRSVHIRDAIRVYLGAGASTCAGRMAPESRTFGASSSRKPCGGGTDRHFPKSIRHPGSAIL